MFLHYSVILYIQKKRGNEPDQNNYNNLFFYIENNLRELGFGDVSVNKKMKDLNKIFYDILIKFNENQSDFRMNKKLILKYFEKLSDNEEKRHQFEVYLNNFYNFCFELPSNNMIKGIENYKYWIMAVPKRKTSISKKKMRRSHHKLSSVNVVEDKKSGEYRLSHHVDLKSGFYNGKKILDI